MEGKLRGRSEEPKRAQPSSEMRRMQPSGESPLSRPKPLPSI